MPSSGLRISGTVAGVTFSSIIELTADDSVAHEGTLPIAWAGTLSTRTDDNTGTLTMTDALHDLDTGEHFDIYWATGCQRNCVAGTVSGTSVPFDLGVGDVLPLQTTAITAQTQTVIRQSFTADDLSHLIMACDQRCHVGFFDDTTEKLAVNLTAGNVWQWVTGVSTNPLAGYTIDNIKVTQANSTITAHFALAGILDLTA
jgi:hypothetical protein